MILAVSIKLNNAVTGPSPIEPTCTLLMIYFQADKNDLGAFRFSDAERDVIIASTDLPGLAKAPILYETTQIRRNSNSVQFQKPHYSISTRGQQLWGTHDVYTDDLVQDEVLTLNISFN